MFFQLMACTTIIFISLFIVLYQHNGQDKNVFSLLNYSVQNMS